MNTNLYTKQGAVLTIKIGKIESDITPPVSIQEQKELKWGFIRDLKVGDSFAYHGDHQYSDDSWYTALKGYVNKIDLDIKLYHKQELSTNTEDGYIVKGRVWRIK